MKKCEKCWGTGEAIDHRERGRSARMVRQRAGISLGEAARSMGISESYLSLLERGKRGWTEKMFLKVVDSGRRL